MYLDSRLTSAQNHKPSLIQSVRLKTLVIQHLDGCFQI